MKEVLFALFILLCFSCTNNVAEPLACEPLENIEALTFTNDVAPIIRTYCTIPTCHVQNFENGDFTNFAEFEDRIQTGQVEFLVLNREMPPTNTPGPSFLSNCEINTILAWIENGALNN